MAIVVVNKNIYKVDSLYQWDINQALEIQGLSLPTIPEIHFTNDAMDKAIVRQATMDDKGIITVEIPNSLLQKPYKITAYVCIYEDETFKSLYKLEIPVKARKKPMDYTIEDNDNEIYSFNALENLVNNTLVALNQKCDETIAETENIKETAIAEMNNIKTNTINEATEIKNETIEEYERIKAEIMGASYDELLETIEELRNDFDTQIGIITPISQIVEGSTKPITSGAVHSLKTEIDESLGDISKVGNSTYNSFEKLLQYYVDNGYLPDVNLLPLIPAMTSNTTPSGECFASKVSATWYPYYAFDGTGTNISSCLASSNGEFYIGYRFEKPVNIKKVEATVWHEQGTPSNCTIQIQASNDGTQWDDIGSIAHNNSVADKQMLTATVTTNKAYTYFRLYNTSGIGVASGTTYMAFRKIQVYGSVA